MLTQKRSCINASIVGLCLLGVLLPLRAGAAEPIVPAEQTVSAAEKESTKPVDKAPEKTPIGPLAMLKGVTDNVLAQLRTHRAELKSHPSRIYSMVEHFIIPYVDFVEMGRWIAGRNAWNRASQADRNDFIEAFKKLLVRTYATSLLQYTDQTIEFMPIKAIGDKERLQVTSYVKGGDRSPIRMDYRVVKTQDEWLVYDIVIEGVSLLKGYQAQFSEDIRQNGLQQVTIRIKNHNAQ